MTSDGAVSFAYFRRALKALNSRVVIPVNSMSTSRGVMVYLNIPNHPDSDPVSGLWEVLAVPSPLYYKKIPKHDKEFLDPLTGTRKWVRGWGTFFRAVKNMRDPWKRRIFSPGRVKALFEKPYDNFDSQKFKRDLNERNETPEDRINRKLRYKAF